MPGIGWMKEGGFLVGHPPPNGQDMDRGDSWVEVSGDLSRGRDRYTMEHMGRVWSIDAAYDTWAMSQYGNITSISESPLKEGLIYVGTDDGLIQVTEDGGQTWRLLHTADLH